MFISYEELKEMEATYLEQLRNAQAHLDVVRDLIGMAEAKEPVKSDCEEIVEAEEETETVVDGIV